MSEEDIKMDVDFQLKFNVLNYLILKNSQPSHFEQSVNFGSISEINWITIKQNITDKLISVMDEHGCLDELSVPFFMSFLYRGRVLDADNPTIEIEKQFKAGSTITTIIRRYLTPTHEECSPDVLRQACTALATNEWRFEQLLPRYVGDAAGRAAVEAAIPELRHDHIARCLVQDSRLLPAIVRDPLRAQDIMRRHPSLARAAWYITNQKSDSELRTVDRCQPFAFDVDYFPGEDEEPEAPARQGRGGISGDQLQTALAALGVLPMQRQSNDTNRAQAAVSSAPTSATPSISADFLQAALSGAAASVTVGAPVTPVPSSLGGARHRFQSQLAALEDMGLTDESVALQALEASNGDLNMALSILFG